MQTCHRRSIRLRDYDYAQSGAYFVTICAQDRACIFGEIDADGVMGLSAAGRIVEEEWLKTAEIRPNVELDAFVVMPNHFHAIAVFLGDGRANVGAHSCAPLPPHAVVRPKRSLGSLVAQFKATATRRINLTHGTSDAQVWQRNYHDRIIRNERELMAKRDYIADNPMNWELDAENPIASR